MTYNNSSQQYHKKLKLQKSILDQLKKLNYPDAYRISQEILEFLQIQNEQNSDSVTINHIMNRIKNNEPWEYIRGWCEFAGQKFIVTPDVLIPRIETEQLVDIVYEKINSYYKQNHKWRRTNTYIDTHAYQQHHHNLQQKQRPKQNLTILEVGTGSGAIILSLGKKLQQLQKSNQVKKKKSKEKKLVKPAKQTRIQQEQKIHLVATDISKNALKTANLNAKQLNSTTQSFSHNSNSVFAHTNLTTTFIYSDLLENIPKHYLNNTQLIIIANLPYISENTYPTLSSSVTQYEPKKAIVGGKYGWELYAKLLQQIDTLLKSNNPKTTKLISVFFEIAPEIRSKMSKLLTTYKYDAETIEDCYGKNRFIVGQK